MRQLIFKEIITYEKHFLLRCRQNTCLWISKPKFLIQPHAVSLMLSTNGVRHHLKLGSQSPMAFDVGAAISGESQRPYYRIQWFI